MSPDLGRIVARTLAGISLLLAGAIPAVAQLSDEQRQAVILNDYVWRNRMEYDRQYREQRRQSEQRYIDDQRRWRDMQRRDYERQVKDLQAQSDYQYRVERQRTEQDSLSYRLDPQLYIKDPKATVKKPSSGTSANTVRSVPSGEASGLNKAEPLAKSPEEREKLRKQTVEKQLRQLRSPRKSGAGKREVKKQERKSRKVDRRDEDDD